MLYVRLAEIAVHLALSHVMFLMMSFCAVPFPTRCL